MHRLISYHTASNPSLLTNTQNQISAECERGKDQGFGSLDFERNDKLGLSDRFGPSLDLDRGSIGYCSHRTQIRRFALAHDNTLNAAETGPDGFCMSPFP